MNLPEPETIIAAICGGGFGSLLVKFFVQNMIQRFESAIKETKDLSVKFAAFTSEFKTILHQIKEDHKTLRQAEKEIIFLKSKIK